MTNQRAAVMEMMRAVHIGPPLRRGGALRSQASTSDVLSLGFGFGPPGGPAGPVRMLMDRQRAPGR